MLGGEHRWRAAAEVESFDGLKRTGSFSPCCLLSDGLDEIADGRVARGVLVERTIRADPVAEGDVDVEEHEILNSKL